MSTLHTRPTYEIRALSRRKGWAVNTILSPIKPILSFNPQPPTIQTSVHYLAARGLNLASNTASPSPLPYTSTPLVKSPTMLTIRLLINVDEVPSSSFHYPRNDCRSHYHGKSPSRQLTMTLKDFVKNVTGPHSSSQFDACVSQSNRRPYGFAT